MPDIIEIKNGIFKSSDGELIMYDQIIARAPGIVFLHGLKSDREGTKSTQLYKYCKENRRSFLGFDMFGHGKSSGNFANSSISRWTDDAIQIITNICQGPQLIVGSSMGGWIMLNIAIRMGTDILGLIGIAAAPDFTENLIWNKLTDKQKAVMLKNGELPMPTAYQEEPYNIGLILLKDGRKHLLLKRKIAFDGPVVLLHGTMDQEVPWDTSIKIAEQLTSTDVKVILVKNGEHNLSKDDDINLIINSIETVYTKIA